MFLATGSPWTAESSWGRRRCQEAGDPQHGLSDPVLDLVSSEIGEHKLLGSEHQGLVTLGDGEDRPGVHDGLDEDGRPVQLL